MLVEGCSDNLRVLSRLGVGDRCALGSQGRLEMFYGGKHRQIEVREDVSCQSNLLPVGVGSGLQCELLAQASHSLQRELFGMSVE